MSAVAVFTGDIVGDVLFQEEPSGCRVIASFSKLPPGEHGFHIHKAGDLRGKGCLGACEHYHKGPPTHHGGPPSSSSSSSSPRHTGDLGNIHNAPCKKTYFLSAVRISDLYGRSVILHEDKDDLGLGPHEDSLTTGHSGKRIGCAIIGRVFEPTCAGKRSTRKARRAV